MIIVKLVLTYLKISGSFNRGYLGHKYLGHKFHRLHGGHGEIKVN